MAEAPRNVLARIRKLALLPEEIKQSRWAVSITKLTTLKSLCQEPEVANRFVTFLARKNLERVQQGKGRSARLDTDVQTLHKQMMTDALAEMEAWPGTRIATVQGSELAGINMQLLQYV
jgi:hypothetical protein